ncbi:kinase-like protein [Glonium stellatum]|uniref:non-specific serine/threonine protein kinase n=1 Tax=Glonium stellatum TaxID=574774 RepID=A0A8E2ESR1_9PEZI|nr:kinase-like protein [Glonium stellatum]
MFPRTSAALSQGQWIDHLGESLNLIGLPSGTIRDSELRDTPPFDSAALMRELLELTKGVEEEEEVELAQRKRRLSLEIARVMNRVLTEKDQALKTLGLEKARLQIHIQCLALDLLNLSKGGQGFEDKDRSLDIQLRNLIEGSRKSIQMEQKFIHILTAARAEIEQRRYAFLESAFKDWSDRGSHVDFLPDEAVPLERGRWLGSGGDGEVVETTCKGIKLAWKRKVLQYKRRHEALKEMNILKKLRHHHIVTLVGTYTYRQFLGLLMWPVAQCDLATVLEYMDMRGQGKSEPNEDGVVLNKLGIEPEKLRDIVGDQDRGIWASFGCLTNAMAYLHENKIRHKDVKPSNILLSDGGIWLTDFGNARDFSAELVSTTEGGARGTVKYCAPEVASYQENGRSADIFSLGCVFLEIMIAFNGNHTLDDLQKLRPDQDRSYQGNLRHCCRPPQERELEVQRAMRSLQPVELESAYRESGSLARKVVESGLGVNGTEAVAQELPAQVSLVKEPLSKLHSPLVPEMQAGRPEVFHEEFDLPVEESRIQAEMPEAAKGTDGLEPNPEHESKESRKRGSIGIEIDRRERETGEGERNRKERGKGMMGEIEIRERERRERERHAGRHRKNYFLLLHNEDPKRAIQAAPTA